jgi:hypothetical protein
MTYTSIFRQTMECVREADGLARAMNDTELLAEIDDLCQEKQHNLIYHIAISACLREAQRRSLEIGQDDLDA